MKNRVIPESVHDVLHELAVHKGGKRWKQRFDNYLTLTGIIYDKCIVIAGHSYLFHPIAENYWRKFAGRYQVYLNELIEAGVIEKEKRRRGRNYYRISLNHILKFSPNKIVGYHSALSKQKVKKIVESDNYSYQQVEQRLGSRINKSLQRVSIDSQQIQSDFKKGLLKRDINNYVIDLTDIPDKLKFKAEVHYPNSVNHNYYKISTLKSRMKKYNLQSFYFKDRIILSDSATFIQRRNSSLNEFITYTTLRFESHGYEIIRDGQKTRRIFHPLVSLPSNTLPYVNIDGESVSGIDAKTSQFAITANLFNHFMTDGDNIANRFKDKRKGFIKDLYQCFLEEKAYFNTEYESHIHGFYSDVINNDFYEVIQNLLNLKKRNQAKIFCFGLLFSKENLDHQFKEKIKEKYPVVISSIDRYKEKFGYKKFPINLQAVEAEIFIDNIFNRLFKEKIYCFTRHDSVVIKMHDVQQAKEIMQLVLSDLNFNMKLKVEDYRRKTTNQFINDSIEVVGDESDIDWDHVELVKELYEKWYDPTENLTQDDYFNILDLNPYHPDYHLVQSSIMQMYDIALSEDVIYILQSILDDEYDLLYQNEIII